MTTSYPPLFCPKCDALVRIAQAYCMVCGEELPFERVSLLPGDLVGGEYRVQSILGRGGMGVVVEAIQVETGERVALKTLGAEALEQPFLRGRFRQEARALSQFDSPHIVGLHRYFEDGNRPFMVLEYVGGIDLGRLLKHCYRLPVNFAISAISQVLRGLEVVHEAGLVHRDIKPSNLLVNIAGEVKVSDFGVALFSEGSRYTLPGQNLGTTAYLSPEMVQFGEADALSDLYSVGITLFELLTGLPPYLGEDGDVRRAHLAGNIPDIRRWVPDIPPRIPAILEQALASHPAHRFPSARAFREALQSVEPLLALHWCEPCQKFVLEALKNMPLVEKDIVLESGFDSRPPSHVFCLFCERRGEMEQFHSPDDAHYHESCTVLDSLLSGEHFSQSPPSVRPASRELVYEETEEIKSIPSRTHVHWEQEVPASVGTNEVDE